ncbi:MAG TPA: D-alanyl-D-alanine carboxypeptidase, partial [Pyrinomonadaceae bacterium]|nr:D-alanyl-D-alanine carboxypeptidase [Pyrinomonadaceae bacterium]
MKLTTGRAALILLLLAVFPRQLTVAQGVGQRQATAPTGGTQQTPGTAPKNLAELRARIQEIVRQPQIAPGLFAVKVVSLETNRVLYEENATKLIKPASNMKLLPVAAALDRLTPEFRFKTSVLAPAAPDATGTLRGDLTIYGRGDPTIAASFNNGDYYLGIDALAARIVAAGVRRVEGDLVGDETYFAGAPFGPGWEWDDLQWEYGTEISALSINDNALDLSVTAGGAIGAPCAISLGPPSPFLKVINRTTTTPRGTKRDLIIYRDPGESSVIVGGSLPLNDAG